MKPSKKYTFDGTELGIVPNTTEICQNVPCATYRFQYDKLSGLHVVKVDNMQPVEFKLYGKTLPRIDKMFRAYERRKPRNTGVLLSGEPGMGKSLFIRIAATRAIEMGLPVFVVDSDVPGVVNFLSELTCPAIVILDEFEKSFRPGSDDSVDGGENSTQEKFLSLMDGIEGDSAKLFIAAVNDVGRLSKYMLNRPGRFLYRFTFDFLSADEIAEVCDSCITDKEAAHEVKMRLIGHPVNYDGLFAIVSELNNGETVADTLCDLNLHHGSSDMHMRCTLQTKSGDIVMHNTLYEFGDNCSDYSLDFKVNDPSIPDMCHLRVSFDDKYVSQLPDGELYIDHMNIKPVAFTESYRVIDVPDNYVVGMKFLPIARDHGLTQFARIIQ